MMIGLPGPGELRAPSHRAALAAARFPEARASLADCRLCAHQCGANRIQGRAGVCRADARARVFSAQMEMGDEFPFVPAFAIALSGCDLRCDFCITGRESWDARAGDIFEPKAVAALARAALSQGARAIMILGGEPTIHLPSVLELVSELPEDSRLVWKTNGHGSRMARDFLDGLFNYWLVDFKFGNDHCGERLARVGGYLGVVTENLRWAFEHSQLVIRHLLMPGHLECCWQPVASWIRLNLPDAAVSLRDGFWPAWRSKRHSELARGRQRDELGRARTIAVENGLNLWQ